MPEFSIQYVQGSHEASSLWGPSGFLFVFLIFIVVEVFFLGFFFFNSFTLWGPATQLPNKYTENYSYL